MPPTPFQEEFATFAGEMAEQLSLNRSIGQIYGLLYMNSKPLSLDEIATRLKMSKGNASINLRTLESWGAVRQVWVSGTRRDHYEANRNLKEIALRRLQEGLLRRLDLVDERLKGIAERLAVPNGDADGRKVRERIREVQGFSQKIRRGLKVIKKIDKFI